MKRGAKKLLWLWLGTTLFSWHGLHGDAYAQPESYAQARTACPATAAARRYDVIVFGDEVPGVMTALKVTETLQQWGSSSRVALITEGDARQGIGGHLVRGGLAYLDRNQVPVDLRSQYGTFGTPNRLYQSFLALGEVDIIALDRFRTARNFATRLNQAGVTVIDNAQLNQVHSAGNQICALTAGGRIYSADQFVDASQSGELAAVSGVKMMRGLEALGLPDSALSLGLIVDVYGLTIEQLKAKEAELTQQLLNPADARAQRWLTIASGGDEAKRTELLQTLADRNGQPRLMHQATADSADVRSLALSIAIHGQLGQPFDLKTTGFLFDRANIAVLPGRLSLNALLFDTSAPDAEALSRSGAKPTPQMRQVAELIGSLFQGMGASQVKIMDEVYVRKSGQIAHPIDELSATLMAAGGLPAYEAIGTFGYHLDDRGGIEGLDDRVNESVLRLFDFDQMPIFNYGFRHTLPQEKENLAVLGPASGFGGLGATAGRIVELNVGVGEGLAIAIALAQSEGRSLHSITNREVRANMGYTPAIYGHRTDSFRAIFTLEQRFRRLNYEQDYIAQARAFFAEGNYPEAERTTIRALTINPRNANTLYLRGNVLLQMQYFEQALAHYTEALRIDPTLSQQAEAANFVRQGLEQARSGNLEQARVHFAESMALYRL